MHTIIPRRPVDFEALRAQKMPPPRLHTGRRPVDIENLLVWTYRDQRADKVCAGDRGLFAQEASTDGHQRYATSGDGVAAMESIGALGVRVSTSRASVGVLHDDAEIVHEAVTRLGEATARLMRGHARHASRPDHNVIIPGRWLPKRDEHERIERHYEPWDKQHHYGWMAIFQSAETATAAEVCAEYAIWRRALGALAFALSTDRSLTSHRVGPTPRAPTAPTLRYATRPSARPRSPSPSSELLVV